MINDLLDRSAAPKKGGLPPMEIVNVFLAVVGVLTNLSSSLGKIGELLILSGTRYSYLIPAVVWVLFLVWSIFLIRSKDKVESRAVGLTSATQPPAVYYRFHQAVRWVAKVLLILLLVCLYFVGNTTYKRLAPITSRISGQIIQLETGTPLADALVRVYDHLDHEVSREMSIQTDSEGRFSVQLPGTVYRDWTIRVFPLTCPGDEFSLGDQFWDHQDRKAEIRYYQWTVSCKK